VTTTGGLIDFNAGSGTQSYAQLGHGGHSSDGTKQGDITVQSNSGIDFAGGSNQEAYTMLGHGGDTASGAIGGAGAASANIMVTTAAGDINFSSNPTANALANRAFAHLGHGGYTGGTSDIAGDITVTASTGGLNFIAGQDRNNNYVHLGHGGGSRNATTGHSGNIMVSAANDIVFTGGIDNLAAGGDQRRYAMIGHGGSASDGDHNGNISVTAGSDGTGSNTFTAGNIAEGNVAPFAQLGHGGQDSDGALSGVVTVAAADNITFTGGNFDNAYAQLGHGGRNSQGNKNGAINVTATNGAITFEAGQDNNAFAQLGHGGHEGDFTSGTLATDTITVFAGTNISVIGAQLDNVNAASQSYAQIGHGGQYAGGDFLGNISVTANTGAVLVQAGLSNQTNAQIGHGGLYNGTNGDTTFAKGGSHTADVVVMAGTNVDVLGGGRDRSYGQIGHGGYDHDGNHSGVVKVSALTGTVTVQGGTALDAYSQVGHGGSVATGSHSGDVVVRSGTSTTINGGTGTQAYSQVGHGGFGVNGDMSGVIHLDVGTSLAINGGTAAGEEYALLGHGGVLNGFNPASPTALTTGSRQGDILLNVGTATMVADNSSIGFMGHLGTAGASATSNFALITGTLDTSGSAAGITGTVQAMGNGGNVEIGVTNGDLNVDGIGAFLNSMNHVDLVASGNVNVTASLLNAGIGAVNVASGWNSTTGLVRGINHNNCPPIAALGIDFSQIIGDDVSYGLGNATVAVGDGTQAVPLVLGSANGATNVLGYGVSVVGSDATADGFAQIGFNEEVFNEATGTDAVASTGAITIRTKEGGLNLEGGGANNAAAQVGHGGNGTGSTMRGDIEIDLNRGVGGGNLLLTGGNASNSDVRLGHGGIGAQGAKSGNIDVNAGSVVLDAGIGTIASSAIGHGGAAGQGDISGTIDVTSTTGPVMLMGGGSNSVAQIGMGGSNYTGVTSTGIDITVSAATGVDLTSGTGTDSLAIIGSGGRNSFGTYDGDINVTAFSGDISLSASGGGNFAGAQIGNIVSGNTASILGGDIQLDAMTGNVALNSGLSAFSFAQVGHGGSGARGDFSGRIKVDADDSVSLASLVPTSGAYAKIGHGDDLNATLNALAGTGDRSGDIQVGATNDITLVDGMIGHLNAATSNRATASSGNTYIAPSRDDPENGTGTLTANSGSEFSSGTGSELRFYLPRRANNQMAAGVVLNGTSYIGTSPDPSVNLRGDEIVRHIRGIVSLDPLQHENLTPFYDDNLAGGAGNLQSGTTAYSTSLGNYSIYYDTVFLTNPPPPTPPKPEPPVDPGVQPPGFFDLLGFFPDDTLNDDDQRDHEERFTRFGNFRFLYEGYDQYGPNGESIFTFTLGNSLDSEVGDLDGLDVNSGAGLGNLDEDVLERQQEILEEEEGNQSSSESNTDTVEPAF